MARALRLDLPRCFYHVLNRGVERRFIYEDDGDDEKFIELLGLMSERYDVEVWSYVLMGNHYHLLVKPAESNLSKAMQWLGLTYSGYFNKRHRRAGPLFQGRFKSFIVEEREYLTRLLCYIHRNPLRAQIVERLADYAWSSYPCLAYGRGCRPWLQAEKVLKLFGGEKKQFRTAVQAYSEEKDGLLEDLKHGIFLGGEKMAARLRKTLQGEPDRDRPQVKKLLRTKGIEAHAREIATVVHLSDEEVEELRKPVRRRRRPMRDLLIYLVWRNSHHSLQAIGEYFHVKPTSLPAAKARGAEYLKKTRKLRASAAMQLMI